MEMGNRMYFSLFIYEIMLVQIRSILRHRECEFHIFVGGEIRSYAYDLLRHYS